MDIEINELSKALSHSSDLLAQYKLAIDESAIVSKTDSSGVITYVNDNFCEASGYSAEELLGKTHNIVRHPDMPSLIFEEMWKTILAKKTWKGIVKNKNKSGEMYIVDATIKPILHPETGEILEFISIRHDITSEVSAKLLAEKALAQKSDFFANVSHELRTPLNIVINFSEDILEEFDEIPTNKDVQTESKESLKKVIKSAKYLLSIINDILDISKLSSKNVQIHTHNENLNMLMLEVYENLKNSTKNDVKMILDMPKETLFVKTYDRYMKQILTNLLSNAVKFTEKGNVTMRLQHSGRYAYIDIIDSGRGIAKEKIDMIFEPFVQVNSFDEGTGLGLKLVKDMCNKLNIHMQVESEPNVGTAFKLKLDLTKTLSAA